MRDRSSPAAPGAPGILPPALARPFSVVVFDWDGTAVIDRQENPSALRERLLTLSARGVTAVVVTGTHIHHVADQLGLAGCAVPRRRLYACTNRGSEVYGFTPDGRPERLWARQATPEENGRLDAIAARLQRELQSRTGLEIAVIANRMNRRKIDLIPLPAWRDPPKARIGELADVVGARLAGSGLSGGLAEALALAEAIAEAEGLPEARITSDVKHIEVGLTDKGDAVAWVLAQLVPALAAAPEDVLVVGDEFGPIAGATGSDAKMLTPDAAGATFVSVGPEPAGVPARVTHLGGGPARFGELLVDQAERARPAPPEVFVPVLDPGWTLTERGHEPARAREVAARFALGNGYAGHQGGLAEAEGTARAATFVAGVYNPGADGLPELVAAPRWEGWRLEAAGERLCLAEGEILSHRRMLDMRRGMLLRAWRHRSPGGRITRVLEARWLSLADRHAWLQQLYVQPENYAGEVRLVCELDGGVAQTDGRRHLLPVKDVASPHPLLVVRTDRTGLELAIACEAEVPGALAPAAVAEPGRISLAWRRHLASGQALELHRFTSAYTSRDTDDPAGVARAHALQLRQAGIGALAEAHESAWRARWEASGVVIEGDAEAQRAIRFATYHMNAAANPDDPHVSVPARGLTGEAYRGHVFWDTDAYIHPFYVYTHPQAARAMTMYRYHTLGAARARARDLGYRGALHAWESADTGADVTPTMAVSPSGGSMLIRTGRMEHHIASAVGHAAWHYWQASGDEAFLEEAGAELVLEIARFWASRAEPDAEGRWHIRHVIGPDEYHEDVDDNAYTNVMASWLLERAVDLVRTLDGRGAAAWRALSERLGLLASEVAGWETVGARLVDGFDAARGVHEQFAGFFELPALDLSGFARPGTPVDLVLGHATVQAAQVIKQADVVMLMHMLEDRFPLEVRRANYRYYEPRTAHGSSLSPGAHAYVAARMGDWEEAMHHFRIAASIDLDNRWGNTAGGVHMAGFGCLWQTVAHGVAGVSTHDGALRITPSLPPGWEALTLPLHVRGSTVRLRIEPQSLTLEVAGAPARDVGLAGEPPRTLGPGVYQAIRGEGGWRWNPRP